jgi:hypothetical protein
MQAFVVKKVFAGQSRMTSLQKAIFYREGAKDTKVCENEVLHLHLYLQGFGFPSRTYQDSSRFASSR